MSKHLGQAQSRRQLLAGVLRCATLGLLGAVGGSVVAKRTRLGREGKCINRGNRSRMRRFPMSAKTRRFSLGICRGCEVFERCGLPQALSAKQVLARIDDGGK